MNKGDKIMTKLNNADIDVARTLHNSGWSYTKIGKYFNVQGQTVINALSRTTPRKEEYFRGTYKPKSDNPLVMRKEEFKEAYKNGMTIEELAKRENCGVMYMKSLIKDYSKNRHILKQPVLCLAEVNQDGRRKLSFDELEEIKVKFTNGKTKAGLAKVVSSLMVSIDT